MKVIPVIGPEIDLGILEASPTIGMIDYSRRNTDDFGVTTVVKRGFARRMSVRLALPFDQVDAVQASLAGLRAVPAVWEADADYDWLNFEGFYKDFELDLAVPPLSFCTLTVEGLAETEAGIDDNSDPATDGAASTLIVVSPVEIDDAALVSSNVPETDYAAWSAGVTYVLGARVIKTATHRIYESAANDNLGNDPVASPLWIDIGPTNRCAMFDQALGTLTSRASNIVLVLAPGAVGALALLDVTASSVRVQATGYDVTLDASTGSVSFLDLPGSGGNITVTITGTGTVSVGTLLAGKLAGLGITGESPTAGITDFSRKEVDEFGAATIVERAWAKRMSARALIKTEKIDIVANRIAKLRATPALWIGDDGTQSLQIYGFFKDFSIEVGENVSTLSLSVEGLSLAAPLAPGLELPSAPATGVWTAVAASAADGQPYIKVDGIIADPAISDVIIRYRVTAGAWLASVVIANGQTAISYFLGPLDGLTQYEVQLAYRNAVGQGPWFSLGLVTTLAAPAGGGNVTTRWPETPPTDATVGDLYFDEFNIVYRFEGPAFLFNGEASLLNGEAITGSGWVLAQDLAIPVLQETVQQSAADLAAVMANFNTRNDLNGTTPISPTVANDGSAFNHTTNANGSVNIQFSWGFLTGDEASIDGFQIVSFSSATKIDAAPGVQATEMVHPVVQPSVRTYTLYGVNPLDHYSIAVRAVRVVDPAINAKRLLTSAWVRSVLNGERPYQPSTELAIAGVTGPNDLVQKAHFYDDFAGYRIPAFAYSTWYDAKSATATMQASIVSSAQANQTVSVDALLFLMGDGGDNDNLNIRCMRGDGVVLPQVYENVQVQDGAIRPYPFRFFDTDVPLGVLVNYKIQWLALPSDGRPFWYDVSMVVDALKR